MWSFLILAKQTLKANKPAAYRFILLISLDRLLLSVTLVRDNECVIYLCTQPLSGERSVLGITFY